MTGNWQLPNGKELPPRGREAGIAHCNSASELELFEAMQFFLDLALMPGE